MRIKLVSSGPRPIQSFEHVERKGLGHPDTLCDSIAERASQYYAQYCHSTFGGVGHHWFDKVVLAGGESHIDWGIGTLVQPYTVLFFGKVTRRVGLREIPLLEILRRASLDVLKAALAGFDETRHLRLEDRLNDYQGAGRPNARYRPVTPEQLANPSMASHFRSNDCNLVSAFAPLTPLEQTVLDVENAITSTSMRRKFPFLGTDVKVFAIRENCSATITVNVPFLGAHTHSRQDYDRYKELLRRELESCVLHNRFADLDLVLNPQDRHGNPYLTALGSAADTGDVGMVGRGNRANGLITPMRPMSIEAPAGKNPTDHTGKIYAKLALEIAYDTFRQLGEPVEVYVFTAKETPIHSPDEVVVVCCSERVDAHAVVQTIVQGHLDQIDGLIMQFLSPGAVLW